MATRIEAGKTTFRYTHADSNPLWLVKAKRGRDCYVCVILNEPMEFDGKMIDSDWVGTQKVFGAEEIRRIVGEIAAE